MSYFVTGATGFIGRRLVQELLNNRQGDIFVLTRASSIPRMEVLLDGWGSDRVKLVVGDLAQPALGVDPAWVGDHRGTIRHFFHLAAMYDMTADERTNEVLNIDGTRHALELATDIDAGCFHQVSSVAASGEFHGRFTEAMFDEGQVLPSPYHRTKFESEKIVREESPIPWRVYRPAIVVGDSTTGEMDKIDGPYYFFALIKRIRDSVPGWVPLVGIDLGDTNVVPVDYVAQAMEHLAHLPGHDGQAFHLVNPEPQSVIGLVNSICRAAGSPQFATPVTRRTFSRLPKPLHPGTIATALLKLKPVVALLDQTTGRVGIPGEVLAHTAFHTVYDSRATQLALAASGIELPPLDDYIRTLWTYWEEQLDTSTADDRANRKALRGKYVVITGASSGIGLVTAHKVAQCGGIPVLVARGKEKLEETKRAIELRGGKALVYPCDLSDLDAIDALCKQLSDELPQVDFLVNNAGRSIRRSLKLSQDRFHDFERTMQLNYFGAIRLVMGLIPKMREHRFGHVVNISSIGVQTNPPRFSAYVASKAALDAWSNVVSSELVGEGISFTNIHMPLVRTPMIAPTKLYDKFPTISPAQAADRVIRGLVQRPFEINTMAGNVGEVAHTFMPRAAFRVLNLAYQVFPDSAAAKGASADAGKESEQAMLAKVFKGVHW
ncbi:SDR family oxidoreductase [Nocardioides cavernaquae]|uniref:SDR family oxidoreductase n=1 Tax=Nocardioides cavernaquae TaxID=2321396 RepID=A0A3A5HG70_9ACTN|nr:SDR family oxidoreductase [Nocardioides cavernaquae]RJS47064.1 SDR family oxidoreductase [Nocardioides cavernaquae]